MKSKLVLCAMFCVMCSLGHATWLEKTLYLPDSLCGVTAPSLVVHNSVNNTVYDRRGTAGSQIPATAGPLDSRADGATNQRIARIAVPSEVGSLEYNATDNKIYAASFVDSTLTVIDGAADTVLRRLTLKSKVVGLFWERTLDKLFCGRS